MLEKEAKEKWCPFSRVYQYKAAINRDCGDAHRDTKCLGSGCACWRVNFVGNEHYDATGHCGLIRD